MSRSGRFLPLAAALLAACAHAKSPESSADSRDSTAGNPGAGAATAPDGRKTPELKTTTEHSTQGLSDSDMSAHHELEAALASLLDAKVFFGFDDVRLTPDGEHRLADVGNLLMRHHNFRIRIEGNCDERGTTQYNIVLGQRRADTARDYLMRMGVAQDQVATVSFGKERPKAPGHDEKAWEQNRRDDVITVGGR